MNTNSCLPSLRDIFIMFLMFCFNAGYKGGAGAKIRRKCGAGAKATTEDDYAKAYSHVKINGRELVTY